MSYGLRDDMFYDHPKVMALDLRLKLACVGLHDLALGYCGRHETDGRLLPSVIAMLGDSKGKLAAELVRVGLWERDGAGYLIHDYLDYNPSHAELEEKRARTKQARSDAGARGMLSRWHNKPITNALQIDNPIPIPIPIPIKEEEEEDAAPVDNLLALALAEIPPSESTEEDYRRTIARYRAKLSEEHIERIIVQLGNWRPAKPRPKLHLTLAQWLNKEPRDPVHPSHEPAVLPDEPEITEEQREANLRTLREIRAGIGRSMC